MKLQILSRRNFIKLGSVVVLFPRSLLANDALSFRAQDEIEAILKFPSPESLRLLYRVIRDLYPHDDLLDGHYEIVVRTLVKESSKNPATKNLLINGLSTIQGRKEIGNNEITDEKLALTIEEMLDSEFIGKIKSTTILNLYNSKDVWDEFGYQGEAYSKGGYIHRGFDDLEWLPNPPEKASPSI